MDVQCTVIANISNAEKNKKQVILLFSSKWTKHTFTLNKTAHIWIAIRESNPKLSVVAYTKSHRWAGLTLITCQRRQPFPQSNILWYLNLTQVALSHNLLYCLTVYFKHSDGYTMLLFARAPLQPEYWAMLQSVVSFVKIIACIHALICRKQITVITHYTL